jgi:hypothetical protein
VIDFDCDDRQTTKPALAVNTPPAVGSSPRSKGRRAASAARAVRVLNPDWFHRRWWGQHWLISGWLTVCSKT